MSLLNTTGGHGQNSTVIFPRTVNAVGVRKLVVAVQIGKKHPKITVIEETSEYRKLFIEMTVADGYGVSNYDPSGCWGGGGEGPPYEVEYMAIELKKREAKKG